MSRLPIRVRLTLGFAVAMAVVLTAVGLFVYRRVSSELLGTVDQTLFGQAREAIGTGGKVDVDTGTGPTLAQLFGPHSRLLHSEPKLLPLVDRPVLARAFAGGRTWLTEELPGRRGTWRVLVYPSASGNRVAVLARSLEPRDESLDHLRHELLIFLPLALLAASLGGYALAAGALRPVEDLRRRAEAVTPSEPSELPVPPTGDEVSRLAVTLNDMLARLRAAVEHERRFVADASHELRTPLALLRTELDLALRRPRTHEELESALRSAAEETQRLSRLADDLLLIARADQGPLPIRSEVVAAADLLADAAARFATRSSSVGRDVLVTPTDLHVDADPIRVGQALVNLVDNALIHGEGDVELGAEARDGLVELHVRDGGVGFPDEFRARAFDRFSRADEARRRGGSGLGLSIVELVARAHGGEAGLRNVPSGGADVWISLPRAADPPNPSTAAQSGAFTAGDPGRRRTGLAAARRSGRAGRGSMQSNRTTKE
ncbi:MAG TPA: HAMP domain-containing sensor histidine kinase [Gaiellaceae bacterium]|nr:HAMP domain-containing sensor histidine kinase [Gaiellaceae bacterium]